MISVVLPTFNERDNILALIPLVHEVLGAREHEIIVVDDDSGDGTMRALGGLDWSQYSADPCC